MFDGHFEHGAWLLLGEIPRHSKFDPTPFLLTTVKASSWANRAGPSGRVCRTLMFGSHVKEKLKHGSSHFLVI